MNATIGEGVLGSLSRRSAIAALALIGISCGTEAAAQAYPARNVRIIVPYAPGGGNDIFARLVAEELSRTLKQQFYIENRPGAGGNIGAEVAARADADGYTLLMANNVFTINPSIYKSMKFDVVKDFRPISLVATSPMVVVVNKSVPVDTVADLLAFAKREPGKLNYGTPGLGTPQHMATELFKSMTGVDIVHVPYTGTGPSVTGLLRNDVNLMFATPASVDQFVKQGDLKAIGVTSSARSSSFPTVPTLAEAGVPGFEAEIWWGLLAPAGVPDPILDQLAGAVVEAVRSESVSGKIKAQAADPKANTPAEFEKLIRDELPRWREIAARANLSQ